MELESFVYHDKINKGNVISDEQVVININGNIIQKGKQYLG